MLFRVHEARDGWLRSAGHAAEAGEQGILSDAWAWVGITHLFGETPAREALTSLGEIKDRIRGVPLAESGALLAESWLEALLGNQRRASELQERSRGLMNEYGLVAEAIHYGTQNDAFIHRCAGDPEGEIRAFRSGLERSGEIDQWNEYLAVELAVVLAESGRDDEAGDLIDRVRTSVLGWNLHVQTSLMRGDALIAARSGRVDEARGLCRKVATVTEPSEFLTIRGDALMTSARVERILGDEEAASDAVDRAVALYERKEAVTLTRLARGWQRDHRADEA